MERSHMHLVLMKTLVSGGLALVNEQQFQLQIVMIREPVGNSWGTNSLGDAHNAFNNIYILLLALASHRCYIQF